MNIKKTLIAVVVVLLLGVIVLFGYSRYMGSQFAKREKMLLSALNNNELLRISSKDFEHPIGSLTYKEKIIISDRSSHKEYYFDHTIHAPFPLFGDHTFRGVVTRDHKNGEQLSDDEMTYDGHFNWSFVTTNAQMHIDSGMKNVVVNTSGSHLRVKNVDFQLAGNQSDKPIVALTAQGFSTTNGFSRYKQQAQFDSLSVLISAIPGKTPEAMAAGKFALKLTNFKQSKADQVVNSAAELAFNALSTPKQPYYDLDMTLSGKQMHSELPKLRDIISLAGQQVDGAAKLHLSDVYFAPHDSSFKVPGYPSASQYSVQDIQKAAQKMVAHGFKSTFDADLGNLIKISTKSDLQGTQINATAFQVLRALNPDTEIYLTKHFATINDRDIKRMIDDALGKKYLIEKDGKYYSHMINKGVKLTVNDQIIQ